IDLDRYHVAVAPGGPVVVRMTALLGGQLARIDLTLRDGSGAIVSVARFRAGHAVTALTLAPGDYSLAVEAHGAPIGSPVAYRVEIYADQPAQRCPPMTGAPTHTETDESGPGHRGNDVVDGHQTPA